MRDNSILNTELVKVKEIFCFIQRTLVAKVYNAFIDKEINGFTTGNQNKRPLSHTPVSQRAVSAHIVNYRQFAMCKLARDSVVRLSGFGQQLYRDRTNM